MVDRDVQLMLIGMLAKDRSMAIPAHAFGPDLEPIADDIRRGFASAKTRDWFKARRISINGNMVDSVLKSIDAAGLADAASYLLSIPRSKWPTIAQVNGDKK